MLEQLLDPNRAWQIHQLRAAGIGDVGDMDAAARAAGEMPRQISIDIAE